MGLNAKGATRVAEVARREGGASGPSFNGDCTCGSRLSQGWCGVEMVDVRKSHMGTHPVLTGL